MIVAVIQKSTLVAPAALTRSASSGTHCFNQVDCKVLFIIKAGFMVIRLIRYLHCMPDRMVTLGFSLSLLIVCFLLFRFTAVSCGFTGRHTHTHTQHSNHTRVWTKTNATRPVYSPFPNNIRSCSFAV